MLDKETLQCLIVLFWLQMALVISVILYGVCKLIRALLE
jgi:hypothetical protein